MNKKTTSIKLLSLLVTVLFTVSFGFGQILTFDFGGLVGNEGSAPSNFNDGFLAPSTIMRGPGLIAAANGNRFNAVNWGLTNIANAVSNGKYMQFTIVPITGYQFNLTTMVVKFQRSSTGPRGIALRSSLDGFTTNIDAEKIIIDNTNIQNFTFSVNQVVAATAVTYRIYGWAEQLGGSGGFEGSPNAIVVNGGTSILPPCSTTTTWNGSTWSSGIPDIGVNAVLAGNYNTGTNGNFSSCSLTVNTGTTLTISDVDNGALSNTYVVVQNDLTVNGTILMNPKANFVQLNGTVVGSGTCEVEKNTAPMNAWYEYTYWSSPVSGAEISTALTDSEPSRRYKFNGQNFLDATAETANNGAAVAGQDGIDDDNNDWQWVNGTTVMQPGVGYAATLTEFAYSIAPGVSNKTFKSTFIGLFNYGEITVPIYRNDSELNDDNWNFIGNPYPSAIDADLFLTANTAIAKDVVSPKSIDGAIFLWSQNTAPSATENGNQALNFATADYAIINGIGQVAGGDGIIPSRKIPSGQGFFVSMSNAASATPFLGTVFTTNVVFNNSMRVRGASDNSQFFKDSNTKDKNSSTNTNKLWVNLTSDNGVFNQTLIGYVDGATNNYDGAYYDAVKNLSAGASAVLYSTIEGLNKVFAIQGRTPSTLNENEVINLGFNTSINVPTIYTLSIAQLEGEFLSNNKVFLKDNLLNTLHELSASDYNFTSEVGAFKDRFEIVFNALALSTDTFNLDANAVQIIQVDDTHVTFKASNNLNIKTVAIYDLLGRQLYQLEGSHHEETYNLSNLNHSVFIAKIELSNGALITKKAIKK